MLNYLINLIEKKYILFYNRHRAKNGKKNVR